MRFNKVNCWFTQPTDFDIDTIATREPDLELVKKSILKHGYRAYCLNSKEQLQKADWFRLYMMGEKVLFYLDGSGFYKLVNIDLTDNELYFEKDNLPYGYQPWIFFSWQSDYNPSRTQIQDALEGIIRDINNNRNPRLPLELVTSTRDSDGARDIMAAIKDNIDKSLLAVFDITNISRVSIEGRSKSYPNANVVFEMCYALQRKRNDQVILVRRRRDDIGDDEVPFDFRQHRHLPYKGDADIRRNLDPLITRFLEEKGFIQYSDPK